jgi:flavin reductase (DIM6/NTAB) family NADH-FMN oxidoreductase RutF
MAEHAMQTAADPVREFRNALGAFATGVTVVTTRAADGTPHGLTVNSFAAVSLDPRLVLWSQSIRAPSFALFASAAHFAVNVLALDQLELSRCFARPAPDKFAGVHFDEGLDGVPVLTGAAAAFECRAFARYPGGDHVIHVGEVERFSYTKRAPLMFARGRYQRGRDLELRPDPDADLAAAWAGLS